MFLAIFDRLEIVFCNFVNQENLFVQYVLWGQEDIIAGPHTIKC